MQAAEDFAALQRRALELKGGLLILSGPSGAGKSALIMDALSRFPRFKKTVTYTTRPPRGQERPGASYHFVSKDEFKSLRERGAFLEWAEVYGELYATAFSELVRIWEKGDAVIKDVDTQGGRSIKAIFPHALRVFVYPPSLHELRQRLIERDGPAAEGLSRRLKAAEREMAEGERYERKIINNSFRAACIDLKKIINGASIFPKDNKSSKGKVFC